MSSEVNEYIEEEEEELEDDVEQPVTALRSSEMRVQYTLTGITPMLQHLDSPDGQAEIGRWRNMKARQSSKIGASPVDTGVDSDDVLLTFSTKGDDRVPAFTWLTYLYTDADKRFITFPAWNIQATLSRAGAKVTDVHAKSKMCTLKANAVGCVQFEECFPKFLVRGKQIPFAPFNALRAIDDGNRIDEHREVCRKFGFDLDIRRATINGRSKHVRVRPVFPVWKIVGTLTLLDTNKLNIRQLTELFQISGSLLGLGDWRPGSPRPGTYGKFITELKVCR